MDWNNELLASLSWLAQAFVLSLAGLALAVVALARLTVWGRQFRRITADYFSPRRSVAPNGDEGMTRGVTSVRFRPYEALKQYD